MYSLSKIYKKRVRFTWHKRWRGSEPPAPKLVTPVPKFVTAPKFVTPQEPSPYCCSCSAVLRTAPPQRAAAA